jgi:hypothetical protein
MKYPKKMSHAEIQSMDVSTAYQQGKVARQRGDSKESNPWEKETQFYVYWKKGWNDQNDLYIGM